MTNINTYKEKRRKFFETVEFEWADMYGEEYGLFTFKYEDEDEMAKIRNISGKVGKIFFKAAKLLRQLDDETLLNLGFPECTLRFIRLNPIAPETVIGRLDLVKTGDTYKVLELNADTPTFIKELFYLNQHITDEFGVKNPNQGEDKKLGNIVKRAIFESYAVLGKKEFPNVVFTSHGDNVEDKNTVLYLKELSGVPSKYCSLQDLQIVRGEGLYDQDGNKIDVLYRQTFPIEMLVEDESDDLEPVGLYLLELVEQNKLAIVNPPSAFLLQTKAVQVAIWGLHEEKNQFFTEEEHSWIEEYFLPTYLEADSFIEKGSKFVKKPSFGREGDTVQIFDGSGELVMEDVQQSYTDSLPVYQDYVDLPKHTFMSEKGEQTGHIMVGCFLLAGRPSAIGYRIGGQITGNLSYHLPIGM